jgi:DNA polymerase I-like protein with 3'-5' exonuclease and polymerase domains
MLRSDNGSSGEETHSSNSYNDIHRQTAAVMFGVPESEVTDDMRRKAKIRNYVRMYAG